MEQPQGALVGREQRGENPRHLGQADKAVGLLGGEGSVRPGHNLWGCPAQRTLGGGPAGVGGGQGQLLSQGLRGEFELQGCKVEFPLRW